MRSEATSHPLLYASLVGVGFVLRFGFMLWHQLYEFPSTAIYEVSSIAAHIARGQGFSSPFAVDTGPTAWVAPAYPYMVAAVFKLFGIYSALSMGVVLGIQCVMAGATGVAIFALAKRTVGERVGLWAAWIWTLSPFFFRWPTSWIWDFTASALLLPLVFIAALDVAEKGSTRSWLRLGGIWGIIALTNPALLSVMPFTLVYAGFVNYHAKRRWIAGLALSAAVFVAMILPWLVRNEMVFGHPVFLRSNYWFEFHLGNYHYSNGMGFAGKHPTQNPRELQKYIKLGEYEYIRQAKDDALQFVRSYPAEYLDLTLHRVWWFWDGTTLLYQRNDWWQPWKFWVLSCTGWLGLLFVLTRRVRGWLLYATALVIYPIPYYLAWPSTRYRHAIEPLLVLLSVYLGYVLLGDIREALQRAKAQNTGT